MTSLSESTLTELEMVAVELARLAGAEIQTALGRELTIRYKSSDQRGEIQHFRDPASEADERIEQLIRARLAERFPEHGILGEEMDTVSGDPDAPVWVIDPIDGTSNFVNGLPLFASSIGVMHAGRAVAGAVWCSTSHAMRTGVYHARADGRIRFDEAPLTLHEHPDLRRYLAGEPNSTVGEHLHWEVRKTGSAALECAFVAAGLLRVARFETPHLWDVAGGLALLRAAKRDVREQFEGRWRALAPIGSAELGPWRRPLIIGEPAAVAALIVARSAAGPG